MNNQKHLIYRVTDVGPAIIERFPPKLVIFADGLVSSTGWTGGQLVLSDIPVTRDTLALDFIAFPPPGGVVLPVISPIRAEPFITDFPSGFRFVIVRAQTNQIRVPILPVNRHASAEAFNLSMAGAA